MKLSISKLLMAVLVFACSSSGRQTRDVNHSNRSDTSRYSDDQSTRFDHDYLEQKGDSIEIPEFHILLDLSDKAENTLSGSEETIVVYALFTGQPIEKIPEKYKDKIDVDGLFIRSYSIELKKSRKASFNGIRFHKDIYNVLADKNIKVLINVFSGRKSSPDNILSCDILQEKVSDVVGKSFTLKGKLIKE